MKMERDLIKGTQFIISTTIDNVRSTGDVMSIGQTTYDFSRFDTIIVDAEYFEKYTQLISASGNRGMLNRVGAVSMDGLYVPYSTSPYHTGSLPHFEVPTDIGQDVINVYALNPFNPSNIFGTGVVSTGVVDTGTYNTGVWASGGHNITAALVNNPSSTNISMETGVHPVSSFFDADFYYRKKTELLDVRSVAHRAPLILSGPGYDINGDPVPTGSGGGMHPQAYSNPSLWKTGPLDVRWDDSRKVWTGGGATVTKIRFKIASSDPTTFTALADILAWDAGFGMNDVPYQIGTPELPINVVEVCDPAGCFLNEPPEDLFDRAGWAMLMDGPPGGFCRDSYGGPPVWEVIQLCCRPYSCNVDQ